MKKLARLMVAPNGARRTKADHPAIPVTIAETAEVAKFCFEAGATAIHAHVRDADEFHVLDAGLYRELIRELERVVPEMDIQITTEAVGTYSAAEQRKLVADVMPPSVSVALSEMTSDGDMKACKNFYHMCAEANMPVQHILYEADLLDQMKALLADGTIPKENLQLMLVLGRYTKDQQSVPEDLDPFLEKMVGIEADWAVCAFGSGETECLQRALDLGGCARVGFENSLWNANGSVATDNVERVRAIAKFL